MHEDRDRGQTTATAGEGEGQTSGHLASGRDEDNRRRQEDEQAALPVEASRHQHAGQWQQDTPCARRWCRKRANLSWLMSALLSLSQEDRFAASWGDIRFHLYTCEPDEPAAAAAVSHSSTTTGGRRGEEGKRSSSGTVDDEEESGF